MRVDAGVGRVDLANTGLHGLADLGGLDEHHVAQLLGGIGGDADGGDAAADGGDGHVINTLAALEARQALGRPIANDDALINWLLVFGNWGFSALGGVGYAEEQAARFLHGGLRAVDATLALAVFGGSASCNMAIEFGVSGPNSTNAMSCASGTLAIGQGFRAIRQGDADVILAGGSEAPPTGATPLPVKPRTGPFSDAQSKPLGIVTSPPHGRLRVQPC